MTHTRSTSAIRLTSSSTQLGLGMVIVSVLNIRFNLYANLSGDMPAKRKGALPVKDVGRAE